MFAIFFTLHFIYSLIWWFLSVVNVFRAVIIMLKPLYLFNCQLDDDDDDIACSLPSVFFFVFFALIFCVANHLRQSSCVHDIESDWIFPLEVVWNVDYLILICMLLMIYNSNNGMNMSLLNCWLATDIALISNSDYVTTDVCMLFCLLLFALSYFNLFTHSLWAQCPRDWLVCCITVFIQFFFSLLLFARNRKLKISLTCNLQLEWLFEVFICSFAFNFFL